MLDCININISDFNIHEYKKKIILSRSDLLKMFALVIKPLLEPTDQYIKMLPGLVCHL